MDINIIKIIVIKYKRLNKICGINLCNKILIFRLLSRKSSKALQIIFTSSTQGLYENNAKIKVKR